MPSSKDIRKFAEKWLDLFDWFEEHPDEDHTVEVETPSQARSLRFEFYRARTAMQNDPGLRDLYPNTGRREVNIEGLRVHFRYKEKTPLAQLIKDSLTEKGGTQDV